MRQPGLFLTPAFFIFAALLWILLPSAVTMEEKAERTERRFSFSPETVLHDDEGGIAENDIAVVGETVHVVLSELVYRRSTDGGRTWSEPRQLASTSGGWQYQGARIAVAGSRVYVVWIDEGEARMIRSSDGGISWGEVTIFQTVRNPSNLSIAALGTDLHIAYTAMWESFDKYVFHQRGRNHGETWGFPGFVSDQEFAYQEFDGTDILVTAEETIHVAYLLNVDAVMCLYYQKSLDGGAHWLDESILINSDHDLATSRFDLEADGSTLVIAFDDLVGDMEEIFGREILVKRSTDGGLHWQAAEDWRLSRQARTRTYGGQGRDIPHGPRLAANDKGLYAVWGNSNGDLYLAFSKDAGNHFTTQETIGTYLRGAVPALGASSRGVHLLVQSEYNQYHENDAFIYYCHLDSPPYGGGIAGGVKDPGGFPVEASIRVGGKRTRSSPETGGYSLRLDSGNYEVMVAAFGYEEQSRQVRVLPGLYTPLNVELRPAPAGTLTGMVLDSANETPIRNALVAVAGTPESLTARTDRNGVYTLTRIPAGTYDVTCVRFPAGGAKGYDLSRREGVEVRAGTSRILDFELEEAEGVYGLARLSGIQGEASAGRFIIVWSDSGNINPSAVGDIYAFDSRTGREFPICLNEFSQRHPITDGRYVVWEDNRNGRWDIYGYDLEKGGEFAVCANLFDQWSPAVSDGVVLWSDARREEPDTRGGIEIRGKVISSGEEFNLTPATPNSSRDRPSLSGRWAVWEDGRLGGVNIHAYDFGPDLIPGTPDDGGEVCIDQSYDSDQNPDVENGLIVWEDRGEDKSLYGVKVDDIGSRFPIGSSSGSQARPSVCGKIVVWMDDRAGEDEWDIYAYDLGPDRIAGTADDGGEFPVCAAAGKQSGPSVFHDTVVWRGEREGDSDICSRDPGPVLYVDGSGSPPFPPGEGSRERPFHAIGSALSLGEGTIIRVAEGTYRNNLHLPEAVTLEGGYVTPSWERGIYRHLTTIEGGGEGNVIRAADHCTVDGFTITGSGTGWYDSGIWSSSENVWVTRNTLNANSRGISCWKSKVNRLDRNLLSGNSNDAIYVFSAAPLIYNNTVADNLDHGIYIHDPLPGLEILNNISTGNRWGIGLAGVASMLIDYNDLWHNTGGDYQGCVPGPHDISDDPLFRDPGEDYNLSAGSLCRDAGTGVGLPYQPPDPDMGAFEYWLPEQKTNYLVTGRSSSPPK